MPCTRALTRLLAPAIAASALLLGGCAAIGPQQSSDPWEGMNRKTFAFNDAVDKAVLKPVAQGYEKVTPAFVRDAWWQRRRNNVYDGSPPREKDEEAPTK